MVRTAYITTITTNTTLDVNYDTYKIDATSNNITITLPNITADGMTFFLRRIDISPNTLTIVTTGGQLINGVSSSALNSSSDVIINSLNGGWLTNPTTGGIGRSKQEFRVAVVANNGNNFLSFGSTSGLYSAVTSFIYRGSLIYGGTPIVWELVYSTTGSSGVFNIHIIDLTNSNNQIVLITVTLPAATVPTIVSTTIANSALIPTTEAIWQIEIQRASGSGSFNFYSSLFQF